MKSKGFTLIEVLVAMGVSVIAGILILQIFVGNNNLFYDQTSRINQGSGLNNILATVTSDIKMSSAVASGYPPSSPTVLSGQNNLVLQIPSIDSSHSTIPNTYDYIVISPDPVNPNILRQQIYPDPQSSRNSANLVLAINLKQVSFNYLDDNNNTVSPTAGTKINITVILNSEHTSLPPASASARVNLRND